MPPGLNCLGSARGISMCLRGAVVREVKKFKENDDSGAGKLKKMSALPVHQDGIQLEFLNGT